MIPARHLSGLFLLFGVLPTPAPAQTLRSVSISADNDGFVFWVPPSQREDRYFTHSMRAEMVVSWAPSWAGLLFSGAPAPCRQSRSDPPCTLTRFSLGQEIYTPNYIFDRDPLTHDRPYAGFLFVEATTASVGEDRTVGLTLKVGVTGDPSLAAGTHRWFHRWMNKHEPIGWEHQILFEPAILLRYQAQRALRLSPSGSRAWMTLIPSGAVDLGNLRTGATFGLGLESGWNIPPSLTWQGPEEGSWFIRLGAGVSGEYVLRDLLLQGNSWADTPRAEMEPLVGRLHGHVEVGAGWLGVEFAATHSTLEFKGQKGAHTFGTLRLNLYTAAGGS